jgi:transposase-like protein
MFEPPFCPFPACPQHRAPAPRFFHLHGHYRARCRTNRVQRYRCKTCRRTFSTQTFRADYRDQKPELNASVVELLCSGVGLRQTARLVRLSRRCLELKTRKLSRCARQLDRNLRRRADLAKLMHLLRVHFDEFETYEERRNTRPVTVATALESKARFIFSALAGPIRPSGTMTERRLRAIEEDERRFGPRKSHSRLVCRGALRRAAAMAGENAIILLRTDEKTTYPDIARSAFGSRLVVHMRTPSVLPRGKRNPLFPINHEEACLRDKNGRVRRESWLVSKRRRYLNQQLSLYCAFRNYVRPRFNHDDESPAQILGLVARRLTTQELVGWRQDWGERSPCPLVHEVRSGYRRRAILAAA